MAAVGVGVAGGVSMTDEDARRVRLVTIPAHVMADFFYGRKPPGVVNIWDSCLPEGCVVLSFFQETAPACFCIVVQHASFDVVPYGERAPRWDGGMCRMYALA